MIRFSGLGFYLLLDHLEARVKELGEHKNKAEQVPGAIRRPLSKVLNSMLDLCGRVELYEEGNVIVGVISKLEPDADCSYDVLRIALKDLRADLITYLGTETFAYVPPARSKYLEQEALFGEAVWKAFPSARYDIQEAGNCYAVGAHTACVFHLMRAVEGALRVLARDLKVKLPGLEFEEWNRIIEAIQECAEVRAKTLRRREDRTKAREFYGGAIGEFRAFKDAWRNHVMHARASYDEQRAQSAMTHVREFMQRLAERLSEDRRRPLRWGPTH